MLGNRGGVDSPDPKGRAFPPISKNTGGSSLRGKRKKMEEPSPARMEGAAAILLFASSQNQCQVHKICWAPSGGWKWKKHDKSQGQVDLTRQPARSCWARQFGLSRVTFREMANKGLIPGLTKASW